MLKGKNIAWDIADKNRDKKKKNVQKTVLDKIFNLIVILPFKLNPL